MSNPGAASTSTTVGIGGGSPIQLGGSATSLIGFYNATPIVQQTKATAVTTTGTTSTTNAYGFTTAAQGDAIVTAVNAIIVQLTNTGLTT